MLPCVAASILLTALLQASDLINAATLSQLEAAEASELTCRDQLNKHLEAFEASQADKVALAKRMEELQVRMQCMLAIEILALFACCTNCTKGWCTSTSRHLAQTLQHRLGWQSQVTALLSVCSRWGDGCGCLLTPWLSSCRLVLTTL